MSLLLPSSDPSHHSQQSKGNPGVGGMNQHTSDGSAFTRVTTAPSTAPATVAISAGMNQTTSGATAANVSTVSGIPSSVSPIGIEASRRLPAVVSDTDTGGVRTEEDEVDSPTPSSTASESGNASPRGGGGRRGSGRHAHRKTSGRQRGPEGVDSGGGGGVDGLDESVGPDGLAPGHDAFAWPGGGLADEHRQLLGTEEESSDRETLSDVEDDLASGVLGVGQSLVSDSDAGEAIHASGGGSTGRSVWAITKEQLNYYTTQFFNMQPNPAGVIPGALAKEFFERSKLPISELRTIWQLSDVSKDGGLSLEEFLTAMHLVVLRRNDIKLPETLPSCLCPLNLKKKLEPRIAILKQRQQEANLSDAANADTVSLASSVMTSPGREKPVNFDYVRQEVLRRDPGIVQPVALRLSDSPVDPQQPQESLPDGAVSLVSVTAVDQSSDLDETEDERAKRAEQLGRPSGQKQPKGEVHYEQLWNTGRDDDDDDSIDGRSRVSGAVAGVRDPRVSSQTTAAAAGDRGNPSRDFRTSRGARAGQSLDMGASAAPGPASLPPSQLINKGSLVACNPPPPPPRASYGVGGSGSGAASMGHARSSSLDLNPRLGHHSLSSSSSQQQPQGGPSIVIQQGKTHLPHHLALPERPHPRYLTSDNTDDGDTTDTDARGGGGFMHGVGRGESSPPAQFGAQYGANWRQQIQSKTSSLPRGPPTGDLKSLQRNIHEYRERNSVVARTINELHQEVSDTLEERIALEYQLEQLKSFGD